MSGKQYVTIIGFTFRHLGDAGIDFFKGSGHGIVNNKTRLMGVQTKDGSDDNCFQNRDPEELVADFFFYQPYHKIDRYRTPVEHKQGNQLELRSRGEGGCGHLPEKIDVRKLHRETTAYAEQARKLLGR